MSVSHVISFNPDGTVVAMHNDKFPLSFLGNQKIERASDIRWDETTQSWGIWYSLDGEFHAPTPANEGFATYESARAFEVETVNAALLHGAHPLSEFMSDWATFGRSIFTG